MYLLYCREEMIIMYILVMEKSVYMSYVRNLVFQLKMYIFILDLIILDFSK